MPPARASSKRTGEKTASGGCRVTTRIAETAVWFTSSVPAPDKYRRDHREGDHDPYLEYPLAE